MSFFNIILKNIWRHRTRTLLTVFGISIGVATIVIFGLVTDGFKKTLTSTMKLGKTDFSVAKTGATDFIMSFLKDDQVQKIKNVEGVEDIAPYVMTVVNYGGNPFFIVGGIDKSKLDMAGVTIKEGRVFQNDSETIIGKITAKNQKLKVGDSIKINDKNFKISGIFESGVTMQDGGIAVSTKEAQRLQGIQNQYNLVFVKVKDNAKISDVADRVEKSNSEFTSVVDEGDVGSIEAGMPILEDISLAITILAVVIGGVGVMNTVIMSVFERTREIGVLRAIGWKRHRILFMILLESVIIGFISAGIGLGLGLLIIYGAKQTDMGSAWLDIKLTSEIFVRALLVSLGVVLFGSIYPAFKASRLQPTEALRYE